MVGYMVRAYNPVERFLGKQEGQEGPQCGIVKSLVSGANRIGMVKRKALRDNALRDNALSVFNLE